MKSRQKQVKKQDKKCKGVQREPFFEQIRKTRTKRFTADEVKKLIRRRNELANVFIDAVISRKLAPEFGRSQYSIGNQIRKLIREGKLDENPNKKKRREPRQLSKMSNAQLIKLAKKQMQEQGIITRTKLYRYDLPLHSELKRRNLLNLLGFKEMRKNWSQMNEDELLTYAQNYIKKHKIRFATELTKKNNSLSLALYRRGLLCRIGFEKAHMDWSSFTNQDLIDYAQKFVDQNDICNITTLKKINVKLHDVLSRRNLLGSLKFKERRKVRSWSKYSNDELVEMAKQFVASHQISGRFELQKVDHGFYYILSKRNLLDDIGFKQDENAWRLYSDEELVAYAQKFIEQKGIKNPTGLELERIGLYSALLRRKLIKQIKFKQRQRSWASMNDEELIAYARELIGKKQISSRSALEKEDSSLYLTALRRKLIDRIFSNIDQSKEQQLNAGLQQAADAMEQFGDAE
jgi:hypothetical protein